VASVKIYSFEGSVIRLTQKDYKNWQHDFAPDVPEQAFYDKLYAIDNWMQGKEGMEKKWFFVASDLLTKWRNERTTPSC
jgi:hypothetical protein